MAAPHLEQRRRGRPARGTRGDTRQELLDAALELFARQGYAATTVRQIADVVGVRDSAMYAHFQAKRELLDTLVDEAGPQLVERIEPLLSGAAERHPRDVLPPFLERLLQEWDRPRPRRLASLLTREGLAGEARVIGPVRERLRPPFAAWAALGLFQRGFSTDLLLWELLAPLAAVRILQLNAQARPAERRRGHRLAREHVAFFLATATE